MSFKEYINEHQQILDEHGDLMDEGRIFTKKYIDKNGMVKTKKASTDPKEKVINHPDGSFTVKKISDAERANLERRKGVKGSKSRRKQKKNLKKHYEMIGDPVRGDEGDKVYKRGKQGGAVQSDLKAREKLSKEREKRRKRKQPINDLKDSFSKLGKTLKKIAKTALGGPKKIWNG